MPLNASQAPVLLWFRRDLRLADNPALAAAAALGRPVVPVFLRPEGHGERAPGGAGLWWLDKSLKALSASLAERGAPLVLRSGVPAEALMVLARETQAEDLFFNRLTGGPEGEAEAAVLRAADEAGLSAKVFESELIVPPSKIATMTGGRYHVFTPFWRAFRRIADAGPAAPEPRRLKGLAAGPKSELLSAWGLHPAHPDWSAGFSEWTPGEAGAREDLSGFLSERLADYDALRDRPDLQGASRLSPRLHWGEISPSEVWRRALDAGEGRGLERGTERFFSELAWREFNHHLLAERPDLPTENFKPAFDALRWRRSPKDLAAWRRGLTGYPMVDAGMRQLWKIGFMHNRVRLIAASFLVKHLLIDWREGEAWFWDTLVDADVANNVMNWQWSAGTGADASPFFRIFNPVAQGQRFDPEGGYVRRYVPELAKLPDRYLHAPWTAPEAALEAAGVRLGRDYPLPIVVHEEARRRALAAFGELRRPAKP